MVYHLTIGLIVIDTEDPDIGLVACLPIGMTQVSSVVFSIEVDDLVEKGQDLESFYFGGSDFVMVFQKKANIHIMQTPDILTYVRQLYGWIGEPPPEYPQCALPPPTPTSIPFPST